MATPDGPWWWASASAMAGIIVGFGLKAAFDAFIERRRNLREDRLRFINEKMRAYAEFGLLCSDIRSLFEKATDWENRRSQLDDQLHSMLATVDSEEQGSDQSDDGPTYEELKNDVAAVKAHYAELVALGEERRREIARLASLIALIAPDPVRDAVGNLVIVLTEDMVDESAYDALLAIYTQVAGEDLGRRAF